MAEKFQNKYRIASTRLQHWDYRWNAAYFVTICTQNREHYFGEIKDGAMQLSGAGIIADILWYEIKNHAKQVSLGSFVVMPNHIHGIIIINNPINAEQNVTANVTANDGANVTATNGANVTATDGANIAVNVEARHALPLPQRSSQRSSQHSAQRSSQHSAQREPVPVPVPEPVPDNQPTPPQTPGEKRFQNQGKNSLSAMVGSYKSAVTKHANRLGMAFGWQTRFYEHIIRTPDAFERISIYIDNNPQHWTEDKFYANE